MSIYFDPVRHPQSELANPNWQSALRFFLEVAADGE